MEPSVPPSAPFSIRRVLKGTFNLYMRNVVKFTLVALVLQSLTLVTSAFARSDAPHLIGEEFDWPGLALAISMNLIVNTLIDAALILCALRALRGQDVLLGDIHRGLRFVAPILAINVIIFVPFAGYSGLEALNDNAAIALARLVLVLGGMMLLVRWFLAPPVMIAEDIGLLAAFRRSALLSKDDRWALFGALMLASLAFKALDWVIAAIGGTGFTHAALMSPLPVSFATEYLAPAIWRAFLAVLAAVSYHTLRLAKEGDSTQEVARVFD
jgi:hypothetical protein